MERKTRSLLEELEALSANRDAKHIIENRATNIISGAIHLLELIEKNYTPEQSAVLERKLLGAIKNKDHSKFTKSLRKEQ